jgi:hypothetical protein
MEYDQTLFSMNRKKVVYIYSTPAALHSILVVKPPSHVGLWVVCWHQVEGQQKKWEMTHFNQGVCMF